MSTTQDWLARLTRKQGQPDTYEDYRRNEALEKLARIGNTGTWAEASRDYNGFVREVAVRELSRQPSPEALAVLIERLNDWVPQVRDLAAEGLKAYLSSAHVQTWLSALGPLMALQAQRRIDHGPTLTAIRALLQSADCRDEVFADFLRQQGKAARYLLALLLEDTQATQTLLRGALVHRDSSVQLMAVIASQTIPAAQSLPLLLEALPGSGAKVRARMLYALLPLLPDPTPVLREALLDASPAVRNLALWAAPRHGIDAHAVLDERLHQQMPASRQPWLGVIGLATELAAQLPEHWRTAALCCACVSVRQGAVKMLGTEQSPELFAALDDPSEKVFAVAIAQLNEAPWPSIINDLTAKLDRDWHELTSTRRLAIFRLCPSWQQLKYLLGRLQTGCAGQAYWLEQINRWCDARGSVLDHVTPRAERDMVRKTLGELATTGRLRSGLHLL